MKRTIFIVMAVFLAGCGGKNEDDKTSGGGQGTVPQEFPAGYVDQGDPLPAGVDSVLGRWVSEPFSMGRGAPPTVMKFRIEAERTTLGIVCTDPNTGNSAQVEATAQSKLEGTTLVVGPSPAKASETMPNCALPASPGRTYILDFANNQITVDFHSKKIVFNRGN